jgi:hypothetical protein
MISFFYPGGCSRQQSDSFKDQQVLKAFSIKQGIHLGWDASISKPPARRVLLLGSKQNISRRKPGVFNWMSLSHHLKKVHPLSPFRLGGEKYI